MKKSLAALVCAFALLNASACTVVNVATLPQGQPHTPFVTTGDIQGAYQSLGLLQITRKSHLLFGYIDLAGSDIQAGFNEVLIPEVRRMRGDGIINVRFRQTQPLPFTQVLQAVFFFVPFLWTQVTITGEVVKLAPGSQGQPVLQNGQ